MTAVLPASPAAPKISVRDYLEMERAAEIRHEYCDGEVIEMSGETPRHNLIAGNLYFALRSAFVDRACEVYFENIRLRVSPTQYRYPDVAALCETAAFDNEHPPCLLNPALLAEVLSPSTQSIDRGDKLFEYKQIPSLTDYLLVAQERVSVVHFVRQNARQWTLTEYTDLTATLTFSTLGITVSLADFYRRVSFETESMDQESTD